MNFIKNMKTLLFSFTNYIAINFGYSNSLDFMNSLIHFNLLPLTIPTAITTATFSYLFGISFFSGIMIILMLVVELLSGILASKIKNIPITSRKMSRFGLKVIVWFTFLAFLNSFILQYKLGDQLMYSIFYYLQKLIITYITVEYLISILENMAVITGKSNNKIIKAISNKWYSFMGITPESKKNDFFNSNTNLLLITDNNYTILKFNEEWKHIINDKNDFNTLLGLDFNDLTDFDLNKLSFDEKSTALQTIKLKSVGTILNPNYNGFLKIDKTIDGYNLVIDLIK